MRTQAERFWPKVVKTDTCWNWVGSIHLHGYGRFYDHGNHAVRAHRWAYESEFGEIPDGMQLDHLCHDPSTCAGGYTCPHRRCVNPAHLALVTAQENLARRSSVLVTACPQGHPYSGSNLYMSSAGTRACVECNRVRSREYQRRRRASQLIGV